MSLQGAHVLVTGGAGFIGSHLVEQLVASGARVVVVDDLSSGSIENLYRVNGQVELRQLDIRRASWKRLFDERQYDVIFHLAAKRLHTAFRQTSRLGLTAQPWRYSPAARSSSQNEVAGSADLCFIRCCIWQSSTSAHA